MSLERVLVPLDTAKCPVEVFTRLNAFAQRPGVTVILLYVINLNLGVPDRRLDAEMGEEAQRYLKQLAEKYVRSDATVLTHVRTGRPAEEILAVAEAEKADLIILPTSDSSWGKHRAPRNKLLAAIFPGVAEKVIRCAPCPVLIVHEQSSHDCEPLPEHPWDKTRPARTMSIKTPAIAPETGW